MAGGMHGRLGMCRGASMAAGVHGRGCAGGGACVVAACMSHMPPCE